MTVDSPRQRDLRRLIAGNSVSTLGNAVYLITVLLVLKSLSESAFLLGLFQFTVLLPGFLLSPIAGAIIDRMPRRTVIVVSDLFRGVLMVAAGFALFIPQMFTVQFILGVSLLAGIGHALFVPAALALVPSLVPPERLSAANGMRAVSTQVANLLGNAVGGGLFVLVGAPLVFVFNGLSFLFSGIAEMRIRTPGKPDAVGGHGLWRSAVEGLRAVALDQRLPLLLVSQAGLFVLTPFLLLSLPFVVIDELLMAESFVGLYFAIALAGGVAVFTLRRGADVARMLRRPTLEVAYIALGGAFVTLALIPNPLTIAFSALLAGASAAGVYLHVTTWIQTYTPSRLHGRVFALVEAASSLAAPISYLVAGALLDAVGSDGRWLLFCCVAAVSAVWAAVVAGATVSRKRSDERAAFVSEADG